MTEDWWNSILRLSEKWLKPFRILIEAEHELDSTSIIEGDVRMPEMVETTQSANLTAFKEGFAQGSIATVDLHFLYGTDPHHL